MAHYQVYQNKILRDGAELAPFTGYEWSYVCPDKETSQCTVTSSSQLTVAGQDFVTLTVSQLPDTVTMGDNIDVSVGVDTYYFTIERKLEDGSLLTTRVADTVMQYTGNAVYTHYIPKEQPQGYAQTWGQDLTFIALYTVDGDTVEVMQPGTYYIPVVFEAAVKQYTTVWGNVYFYTDDTGHSSYWNSGYKNVTLVNNSGGKATILYTSPTRDRKLFFGGLNPYQSAIEGGCLRGGRSVYRDGNVPVYYGVYMPFKLVKGFDFAGPSSYYHQGATDSYYWGSSGGFDSWFDQYAYYYKTQYEGWMETPHTVEDCTFTNMPAELRNTLHIRNCVFSGVTRKVFDSLEHTGAGSSFKELVGEVDRCVFKDCRDRGINCLVHAACISNCVFVRNECGFPARGFITNSAFVNNSNPDILFSHPDSISKSKTVIANSYLFGNKALDYDDSYDKGYDKAEDDYREWGACKSNQYRMTGGSFVCYSCVYDSDTYNVGWSGNKYRSATIPLAEIRKFWDFYSYSTYNGAVWNARTLPHPETKKPSAISGVLLYSGETYNQLRGRRQEDGVECVCDLLDEWSPESNMLKSINGVDRDANYISVGPTEELRPSQCIVVADVVGGLGSLYPRVQVVAPGQEVKISAVGNVVSAECGDINIKPGGTLSFKPVAGLNKVSVVFDTSFYAYRTGSDDNGDGSLLRPFKSLMKATRKASTFRLLKGQTDKSFLPKMNESRPVEFDRDTPVHVYSDGDQKFDSGGVFCDEVGKLHVHMSAGSLKVGGLNGITDYFFDTLNANEDTVVTLSGNAAVSSSAGQDPVVSFCGFKLSRTDFEGSKHAKYIDCSLKYVLAGDTQKTDGTYYGCDIVPASKGRMDGTYISCIIHDQITPEWASGILEGAAELVACKVERCRNIPISNADRCYFEDCYSKTVTGTEELDGKKRGRGYGNFEYDPFHRLYYPGCNQSVLNGDKEKILTVAMRERTVDGMKDAIGLPVRYVESIENMKNPGDRAVFRRVYTNLDETNVFDHVPVDKPDWLVTDRFTDFGKIGLSDDTLLVSIRSNVLPAFEYESFVGKNVVSDNFVKALGAVMYYAAAVFGITDVTHMYDYISNTEYRSILRLNEFTSNYGRFSDIYRPVPINNEKDLETVKTFVRSTGVLKAGTSLCFPFDVTIDDVVAAADYAASCSFERENLSKVGDAWYLLGQQNDFKINMFWCVVDGLNLAASDIEDVEVDGVQRLGLRMPGQWFESGNRIWSLIG